VLAPVNLISSTLALRPRSDVDSPDAAPDRRVQANRLQVLLLEALRHPAVALDATDEENTALANTLHDEAPSPVEQTAGNDLRAWVDRSLAELTDKQQHVLRRRFGLGGAPEQTLSEIARASGISHQQAGMRERRALRRLESSLAPIAAEWYADA
jgi:RNA polymerase sigma factor (sigma-70 family)